jgi:hypothetical protein
LVSLYFVNKKIEKIKKKIYDKFYSSIYDELLTSPARNQFEVLQVKETLLKKYKNGKPLILDIGCGQGTYKNLFLDNEKISAANWVAVEVWEPYIRKYSLAEKYNKVIKNLDKMLEKICSGTNLNIFIGNKPQIKIKRQEIIKMLIDLIAIQNETMKMSSIERKNRLETASKKYCINKELSQFFLFELKNDIFVYS